MEIFLVSSGLIRLMCCIWGVAGIALMASALVGHLAQLRVKCLQPQSDLLKQLSSHGAQGDGLEAGDVEELAESVASRIDVLVRAYAQKWVQRL